MEEDNFEELANLLFGAMDDDEAPPADAPQLPPPQATILVMGLDESGKTSTLSSLCYGQVVSSDPTGLSEDIRCVHKGIRLLFREIGGRFRFRSAWPAFFPGVNALIWIVDSTDRGRILESRDELEKVASDDRLANVPILLVLNKQDLRYRMETDVILRMMAFERYADRVIKVVLSAKTACAGLMEAMDWLMERLQLVPEEVPPE
jgi:small GTP-binding protein